MLALIEPLKLNIHTDGGMWISGYPNPLYDQELAGWRRVDFAIDNKAAGGKTKRQMTESIWMNF